jgi:hypothetical protein
MNRSIVVTVLALAAVAACAGKKDAAADSAAAAAAAPAAAPAAPATPAAPTAGVVIVSPKEGDSTGHDVTVVMTKEGGLTIAKADSKQVEGVGHYHLFLDTIPSAEGQAIPPNSKNTVHIGTGDSTYTFKGLAAGKHQIIAVVGYGNHIPMTARRDTVNFVVKP